MNAAAETKRVIRESCADAEVWWSRLESWQVNAIHAALKREGWLRSVRERAAAEVVR